MRRKAKLGGVQASPLVHGMVGQSIPMLEVYKRLERYAHTDFPVLISGETGTGKELAARALHSISERRKDPFVAVDAGSLNSGIMGSLIFGHTEGAYTGADHAQTGFFDDAHGGTLFLDEIGNLELKMQQKLLRVIEEKRVTPVGESQSHPIDVRVVTATNNSLEQLVREGKFRKDLYYRLNVLDLKMPPLRERMDDVLSLANYFLTAANSELDKRVSGFSPEAHHWMQSQRWPGNVRELKNLVTRCVALGDQPEIPLSEVTRLQGAQQYQLMTSGNMFKWIENGVHAISAAQLYGMKGTYSKSNLRIKIMTQPRQVLEQAGPKLIVVYLTPDTIDRFFCDRTTSDYHALREAMDLGPFNRIAHQPFGFFSGYEVAYSWGLTSIDPFSADFANFFPFTVRGNRPNFPALLAADNQTALDLITNKSKRDLTAERIDNFYSAFRNLKPAA